MMNRNISQIHCTWKAVDGKDISEAVTWLEGSEKSSDIEETIQAENCLLLESGGKSAFNTECRLSLFCQPPYTIQQVSVLCEARLVEVYGQHQEYLQTLRCEMVDEMDDMIVFRAEVKLDRPLSECSIKFTGLKSKTSMWLYGVVVYVNVPLPAPTSFHPAMPYLTSPQGVPDRNRRDEQMMAFMSLLGTRRPPMDLMPRLPLEQQYDGILPPSPGLPDPRIGAQLPQQPYTAIPQNPTAPEQHIMNQFLNTNLSKPAEKNANVTDNTTSSNNLPPQVPPELAQLLQLISPDGDTKLLTNLLQKMQNGTHVVEKGTTEPSGLEAARGSSDVQQETKDAGPTLQAELETVTVKPGKEVEPKPPEPVRISPVKGEPEKMVQEALLPVRSEPMVAAGPVNKVITEPLSEAVTVSRLSGGAVEQISEAVVTNLECSLEHLEERLWGKVRHRLQEMETKILNRLDEMFDALHEEIDSETRDLQDLQEEEVDGEDVDGLDMDPGILEI